MASAGSIVVDLLARTGSFTTDIDRSTRQAERRMRDFEKQVKTAAAAVGAAVAGIGVAFGAAVQNVIAKADETEKAAQKLGVTGEALTTLRHAADLSGVSADQLAQGLTRLNKAAAEGNQAFDAMGISARNANGTLKTSDQLLKEVATKFAGYKDGAAKAALAQQLFGRSGAEMIPLLNAGAAGIAEMQAEAESLGLVLDQQTRKAAEAFGDNLTRLKRAQEGVTTQIAAQLLPTLVNLTDRLVGVAKNSDAMAAAARVAASALKLLLSAGVIVGATFKVVGEAVGATAASVVMASRGDFAGAWDALKWGASDAVSSVQKSMSAIDAIWDESAARATSAAMASGAGATGADAPIVKTGGAGGATRGIKAAVDRASEAVERQIRALSEQAATFGLSEKSATLYKLSMQGATDAQLRSAEVILGELDALRLNNAERERLNALLAATPTAQLEAQRETMQFLARAFEDSRISAEQFSEAAQTALGTGGEAEGGYWEKWLAGAEEALTTFDKLANNVIENFSAGFGSAFEAMVFDAENLGESLKGMAEGMARSVVNALGQMAAQWLAYQAVQMLVGKTTAASAAGAKTFEAMAAQQMAALNAFAATAAIPIVGPAMAPAAAGAALAATSPFVATVASLSAAAVGARADGGPVSQGMAYLVGERGPELFVPGTSGAVVPNNKIGGGNVTVNLIEDKRRAGQTQERDNNGARELDVFVADIMGDGPRSKAIRQAFGLQRRGY